MSTVASGLLSVGHTESNGTVTPAFKTADVVLAEPLRHVDDLFSVVLVKPPNPELLDVCITTI